MIEPLINDSEPAADPDILILNEPDSSFSTTVSSNIFDPAPSVVISSVGWSTCVTYSAEADVATIANTPLSNWYPSSYNKRTMLITPAFLR